MVKSFKTEVLEPVLHKLVSAIWENRTNIETNRALAIAGVVMGSIGMLLGCFNTWVLIANNGEYGAGGQKVASDLVLQNIQTSTKEGNKSCGGVQYIDKNKGCQRD